MEGRVCGCYSPINQIVVVGFRLCLWKVKCHYAVKACKTATIKADLYTVLTRGTKIPFHNAKETMWSFWPLVAPRFDEVSVWFESRGRQVWIYINMQKLVVTQNTSAQLNIPVINCWLCKETCNDNPGYPFKVWALLKMCLQCENLKVKL